MYRLLVGGIRSFRVQNGKKGADLLRKDENRTLCKVQHAEQS